VTIDIRPTPRDVAHHVAERLCAVVRARPTLVLGLPTGRTPIPIYRRLAALVTKGAADFSRVTTFNLDEFVGLPPDHPGSYRAFMHRHVLGPLRIDPERAHFLDGVAPDLDAECERYEAAIAAEGGIDIQMLGIGANGHIGFNEPGPALLARTHRTALRLQTRRANAMFFGNDLTRVPEEALSMGVGTILQARAVVLVATGRGKRIPVGGMVAGRVTTRLPASFLQLHDHVDLYLDTDAASALPAPHASGAVRA
jgi:glucosamine-6-phosphate deaminase